MAIRYYWVEDNFFCPVGSSWKGGMNPYSSQGCLACDQSGKVKGSECAYCEGWGELWQSAEFKKLYDSWESPNFPSGSSIIMFDTISDRALSPTFKSKEDLATWLSTTKFRYLGGPVHAYDWWIESIGHSVY